MDESTSNPAGDHLGPPEPSPSPDPLTSAPTEPTPAPSALGPSLSWPGTLFWSLTLLAGASFLLLSITTQRELLLDQPERYLERVVGRDLDAADYAQHMPTWQKWLNSWDSSDLSDVLHESIKAYQNFRRQGALEHPGAVARTLAILLAEAGRLDEARQELASLDGGGIDGAFRAVFQQAYLDLPTTNRLVSVSVDQQIAPDWARDKLQTQLANKRRDRAMAGQIQTRILRRGKAVEARTIIVSMINLILVGAGLAAAVRWIWRRPSTLQLADGVAASPWTLGQGYAVLVRGAAAGMIVAGCLSFVTEHLLLLTGFTTLVASLPLFGLAWRFLLKPNAQTIHSCFGLHLSLGNIGRLGGLCLITMCCMLLGETVISALTSHLQEASLTEVVPEEFLFDRWPKVLLSSMDAVVWAPVVEEIAFRGLLYTTLRRRLPRLWANLLGSIIFAGVHGYSLQGFLIILWSGFLWTTAYEKSRSLLPGMVCHALSNALAVITPVLVYRL